MENRPIRMSREGFAEFMAVLSGPATPVPEMVEVAKRPAPWAPGYAARPDPTEELSGDYRVTAASRTSASAEASPASGRPRWNPCR
jgi:hypothetical protein